MSPYVIGQRYTSAMEPELGMGQVVAIEGRRLTIHFAASEVERIYATASAPLQRVRFAPGDQVCGQAGTPFTVTTVTEEEGLLVYCGEGARLVEDQLAVRQAIHLPHARLMAGGRDASSRFDLRLRMLNLRAETLGSPVHGFVGGRVALIPHQLAIAETVCRRRAPRVLLADETGLGKTIEAGLIVHRLITTGRIARAVVVVPDALVVQWYVELARRFNLRFRILDDRHPPASAAELEDEPLVLCAFGFLEQADAAMQARLIDGNWDMALVDEAHHMRTDGALFAQVAKLAATTPGLILITATPGQLAARDHFARLQLLDPQRYDDYARFVVQTERFEALAVQVQALREGGVVADEQIESLAEGLAISPGELRGLLAGGDDAHAQRQEVVQGLIDRHGTGRVMFRTRRDAVAGFPGRRVTLVPLDPGIAGEPAVAAVNQAFRQAAHGESAVPDSFGDDDPRIGWLVEFLRNHRQEKTLLICSQAAMVESLVKALANQTRISIGRFHEKMSLVQRDRNAAWFADPKGAVMLACSEIGSEGRNFQFARHLVLFDLPVDSELLEQRIGRLDRIGQREVVQVVVPYLKGSAGEVLARWYHEALNAMEEHVPAAAWVSQRFLGALVRLVHGQDGQMDRQRLDRLIRAGKICARRQTARIRSGRDRLLDWSTPSQDETAALVATIEAADTDDIFAAQVEALLDLCGIVSEPVSEQVLRLVPDERYGHPMPGFRPAGQSVTFERSVALEREEVDFLTMDHPLVAGATDYLLGSDQGNAAFVHAPGHGPPRLVLEMVFVLEAAGAAGLMLERFLPPLPIHLAVDHERLPADDFFDRNEGGCRDGSPGLFEKISPLVGPLMSKMVTAGQKLAEARAQATIKKAGRRANDELQAEVERLKALAATNAAITVDQIEDRRREKQATLGAIAGARVRLDAVRLVVVGEVG